MQQFLQSTPCIDWMHPDIRTRAGELAQGCPDELAIVRNCFHFVRDQILHSWDHQRNPVTCKASDVLRHGTGFCYAKAHLLAALCRANGIPAGLCYQRLTIAAEQPPYCLHGLNAIHLQAYGWFRLDARGNKPGVAAECTPPLEQLAFAIRVAGEADLPEIWPEPLPEVVRALQQYDSYDQLAQHLPDVTLWN